MFLKFCLGPGRWQRRIRRNQMLPFEIVGIEQGCDVGLIGLGNDVRALICDRTREILVGKSREVVAEFVHEQVRCPLTVCRVAQRGSNRWRVS